MTNWIPAFAGMTILLSACQWQRAPVPRRPLPIEGRPSSRVVLPHKDEVLIGLRVDVSEITVASDSLVELEVPDKKIKEKLDGGEYQFAVKDNQLKLNGVFFGNTVRLRPGNADFYLKVGNNNYRGVVVVQKNSEGRLTVINELTIDDYLKGVLPREVVVSWPTESLRVQAVASRSYLASHLGRHKADGFDLCADVHCQVYGGTTKEHPRTNEAVEATRDEILTYNEKPIGAFFHSNCGGTTEHILHVWGQENRPYLPRKKCGFGTKDPRYHWKLSVSGADILKTLSAKTKVRGKKLISLKVKKKSPSGRAETVTVTTDEGAFDLPGNDFRIAMNPEKIRSTLWTNLSRHGDGYQFTGRGWGHGVGMCQWGAKGQAENGKDYRDILQFYYPHTTLQKWSR